MKLISMTSFAIQQWQQLPEEPNYLEAMLHIAIVQKYAEFLKQPLMLRMFVPCDEEGNVLEIPNYYGCFLDGSYVNHPQLINYENCMRYKKAEEKVLFEGFELIKRLEDDKKFECYRFLHTEKIIYVNFRFSKIIEDLIVRRLELTESAIKQIGLNP